MTDKPRITCKWLEDDNILINPDGQVLPCCYLGNTNFLNDLDSSEGRSWNNHEVLIKYKKNKKLFNLNYKTLDEILTSEWFNVDLPKSWESYDTLALPCKTFCDGFEKKL